MESNWGLTRISCSAENLGGRPCSVGARRAVGMAAGSSDAPMHCGHDCIAGADACQSPSTRVVVHGSHFGGSGDAVPRKEGDPPSLEEHLNHCGLGWFQYKIFLMAAAIVAADGMEMTVISLLRKPLTSEWDLSDETFSLLGSSVFLGLLIGNMVGGSLADLFGRKKCIIGITVVFCLFGTVSAFAPDVYVFAVSRFFTGVGVGSMVPVSDSHLLEWSPNAWRAKLAMTLTGVAFALGAAFACVVGIVLQMTVPDDPAWWRYMLILCVLPGLASLPFVCVYFPESPHWLLVNKKEGELEALLKQLAHDNGVEPLDEKCAPCSEAEEPTGSQLALASQWWSALDVLDLKELFSPALRSSTSFCTVVWVVCGFVYYGHIFIYPVLLEDVWQMTASEGAALLLRLAPFCLQALRCVRLRAGGGIEIRASTQRTHALLDESDALWLRQLSVASCAMH